MRFTKLLTITLLTVVAVIDLAAETAPTTTMKGSYVTVGEYPDTGKIEAVFTPAGQNLWEVVFSFDFQELDYTFSGVAEGSLTDGPLSGTVQNDTRERTFTFRGTVTGGHFEGTHAEVEYGGETPTGTMTLDPE